MPLVVHPETQGSDAPPPPRRCEYFLFHKNPPSWRQTEGSTWMPDGGNFRHNSVRGNFLRIPEYWIVYHRSVLRTGLSRASPILVTAPGFRGNSNRLRLVTVYWFIQLSRGHRPYTSTKRREGINPLRAHLSHG